MAFVEVGFENEEQLKWFLMAFVEVGFEPDLSTMLKQK